MARNLPGSISYRTDDGKTAFVTADITIIAAGNTPPAEIKINGKAKKFKDARVLQSPLENIAGIENFFKKLRASGETKADIILQGFGNTGIDLALVANSLASGYNIDLTIHAIQRHNEGIVKHPEDPQDLSKELRHLFINHTSAEGLWKAVTRELAKSSFAEGDIIRQGTEPTKINEIVGQGLTRRPQDVIDALRSVMNDVWGNFTEEEKRKWKDDEGPDALYRYLRNRVTRQTGSQIEELIGNGKLKLYTGEILRVFSRGEEQALKVTLNVEDHGDEKLHVFESKNQLLLNTAGPDQSLEASPLLSGIRDLLVGVRAIVRGFLFRKESNLVQTADDRLFITALSHNGSKYLEDSGVREKRAHVEEAIDEVLDVAKTIRANKQLDKRENLLRSFSTGAGLGEQPEYMLGHA